MLHSRKKRLEELVKEEVARIIDGMKDPRVNMVTVTDVRMSSDLKLARVYVSTLEKERVPQVISALKGAHGFIRKSLGERLVVKYLPDVEFFYDDTFEHVARIEELLGKIREENPLDSETQQTGDDVDNQ
jgi:ribosome-binding factor A